MTMWAKGVPGKGMIRAKALGWGMSGLVEEEFLKAKPVTHSFMYESDVNYAK